MDRLKFLCIRKKFKKFLNWRTDKKGQWALKGKPSIVRLSENKKPKIKLSRKSLENLAKVKIAERRVRPLGNIFLYNTVFHTSHKLAGEKVELWETLKGLEIRKGNKVYDVVEDYWERKSAKNSKRSIVPKNT